MQRRVPLRVALAVLAGLPIVTGTARVTESPADALSGNGSTTNVSVSHRPVAAWQSRDGVTNAPPVNGNTMASLDAADDDGYFRDRADAFYRSRALALG